MACLKPHIPWRGNGEATGTPWPPHALVPGCHVPMVVLTWCPQPQCHQPSQAPPPALTSQRCLELVPGAALDPSSGLSSTALRAARGGAEPSGSGWQLAGMEPAGRDREAVARPRCPAPLLPQGTAQPPWGWGDRGGTGLGTSGRYLSGAGARAAAAPDPGAQPGRPRAGSAAVPGPAQRRSGPASAAPLCLENPPPARPWAMQSPQGPRRPPGTFPCSPNLHPPTLPGPFSCLRDVHLLHLSQGGCLEQDTGPWPCQHGACWWPAELKAGAGGQAAGAGVGDAGQGAVACRQGQGSAPV